MLPEKQASKRLAALVSDICGGSPGAADRPLGFAYPGTTNANDRVLGTELAGGISRERIFGDGPDAGEEPLVDVTFGPGSVAGGASSRSGSSSTSRMRGELAIFTRPRAG